MCTLTLDDMTTAAKQVLPVTDERSVAELHEAMMGLVLQGIAARPDKERPGP